MSTWSDRISGWRAKPKEQRDKEKAEYERERAKKFPNKQNGRLIFNNVQSDRWRDNNN